MKRKFIYRQFLLLAALLAAGLVSCNKEPAEVVPTKPEIGISVMDAEETRAAVLYESTAGLRSEMTHEGEGPFIHTDAYWDGTTTKYFNSHIFYFAAVSNWRFADGGGNIVHFYWPPDDSYLNFLAYSPETLTYTGVTIGSYTDRVPTFDCNLPVADNQTYSSGTISMKEFIYAFEAHKNKTNDSESAVPLQFRHPLAAIYLSIASAKQRMTLNSVTFKRIYKKGTGTYNSVGPTTDWEPDTSDGTTDFTISIGGVMGTDMHTGSTYGPFIVMPQVMTGRTELADIKMVVNYTPYGGVATNSSEISITSPSTTAWAPSKKYTYALDLGTDDGAVNINISVTDWDNVGSYTDSDVD